MLLTIFTPTYNRAHTLSRLYESLRGQTSRDFEWLVIDDGSTDGTYELVSDFIKRGEIPVRYIRKPNGGLYTCYNSAYANISTELCVCVDSDDFMPSDAVSIIVKKWRSEGSCDFAGLIGLDFYADTDLPIGGYFPDGMKQCHLLDLYTKKLHRGDKKIILRTDLVLKFAPQEGFPGEKFFNPNYLHLQACDNYPLLVINKNLCYVDMGGTDRMSIDIYNQYLQSPRSFAKQRLLEMNLRRSGFLNRYRSAVHYVAESLIAGKSVPLFAPGHTWLSASALLPGVALYLWIKCYANGANKVVKIP